MDLPKGLAGILQEILSNVKDLKFINLTDRKKFQLHYITNERAKWREKIKDITKELIEIQLKVPEDQLAEKGSSYKSDIRYKKCIAKLQPNINPYSVLYSKEDKGYYEKDGHIYDIIKKQDEGDLDDLIIYLTFLLKYDWERSKEETLSKNISDDYKDEEKNNDSNKENYALHEYICKIEKYQDKK